MSSAKWRPCCLGLNVLNAMAVSILVDSIVMLSATNGLIKFKFKFKFQIQIQNMFIVNT